MYSVINIQERERERQREREKISKIIFKWVIILEVILIFIMNGQCIHFAFKGACLSPILLGQLAKGRGLGCLALLITIDCFDT